MKTGSEKIREIMESVEGIESAEGVDLEHKKRKVMDALLSFSQKDLLQIYVDEFTDQEAMEYWLKVDADALPETPEIAREWLKANHTEESSSNLAEMIFDGWDSDDNIQTMYSIYYSDDEKELDEVQLDFSQEEPVQSSLPQMSREEAFELLDVAMANRNPVPEIVQDALAYYRRENSINENIINEFTISDVENTLRRERKSNPEAIAELRKLQHRGNLTRTDLEKVGLGNLLIKNPQDIDYGEDMPELVKTAHEDPQAWDRAMWSREVDEDMDDFGYDDDAEMDRESTVQTQIDDIVAKSNVVIDKIGPDGNPTPEQERVINGFADEITRLEKSLED